MPSCGSCMGGGGCPECQEAERKHTEEIMKRSCKTCKHEKHILCQKQCTPGSGYPNYEKKLCRICGHSLCTCEISLRKAKAEQQVETWFQKNARLAEYAEKMKSQFLKMAAETVDTALEESMDEFFEKKRTPGKKLFTEMDMVEFARCIYAEHTGRPIGIGTGVVRLWDKNRRKQ
jgi:hypothetical protein